MRLFPLHGACVLLLAIFSSPASVSAQNLDIEPEDKREPFSIFLENLEFQEGDYFDSKKNTLVKNEFESLEVYKESSRTPLQIHASGKIFGKDLEGLHLVSLLLPSLEQKTHPIDGDTQEFDFSISLSNAEIGSSIQLLLSATKKPEREVVSGALLVREIHIRSEQSFLSIPFMIVEVVRQKSISIILVILLVTVMLLTLRKINPEKIMAKTLAILIVIGILGAGIFQLSKAFLITLHDGGFLPSLDDRLRIQKAAPEKDSPITLTILSDNLEVEPGLATSWSHISSNRLEMSLRESADPLLSAKNIQEILMEKMNTPGKHSTYLSSIQDISQDHGKLLITTSFPDPLLPQKLSKVPIKPFQVIQKDSKMPAYLLVEDYPDHVSFKRNEKYFGLPFLSETPLYRTVVVEKNLEALKKQIPEKTIHVFDEPDPSLWPLLSKSGYRIIPKLNTDIVVLMTDRKNSFLKDKNLIEAMRKTLQSARILQSSYFQYGRLGKQFAPPGVVGYLPSLQIPEFQQSPDQVIDAIKSEQSVSDITLKLHYPSQEKSLALIIEEELERAGLTIIPVEIPKDIFQESLLKKPPDLTLIPLQFELADIAPFLDTFIDSRSQYNAFYRNADMDLLIEKSRQELSATKRLKILHEIMRRITIEDPAGIPILFKRSFMAKRREEPKSWLSAWFERNVKTLIFSPQAKRSEKRIGDTYTEIPAP